MAKVLLGGQGAADVAILNGCFYELPRDVEAERQEPEREDIELLQGVALGSLQTTFIILAHPVASSPVHGGVLAMINLYPFLSVMVQPKSSTESTKFLPMPVMVQIKHG